MKTTTADKIASYQTLKRVGQCLYRAQESDTYYAILKRAGKQIKRSLKTSDQALAKRRLAELRDKAARLNSSDASRTTFEALASRWLEAAGASMKRSSYERQCWVIQSLNRYIGTVLVRGISKAMIEQWAAQRIKEASARTVNFERQTLIRILAYAMRDGLILDNPALVLKRMQEARHKVIIPSRDEFRRLVATMRQEHALAQPGADLCEFLAYSGCQRGEATAVTWGDVNFEGRTFTVTGGETGTKNHEARVVPLFPALEKYLLTLKAALPHPPAAADRIITIRNAQTSIDNACKKAGLPHFSHHSLRHFFCSNAIEAGIDFKAIAGWLGHKDGGLLVARTYGHLRDEHSAAMAQRMTFGADEESAGLREKAQPTNA